MEPKKSNAAKSRPKGRPKGRTQVGEATKAMLYQTAMQLFVEGGYQGTTMRQIAKRAGVSSGLLYKYFRNKPALVLALYDERSAAFSRAVTQELEQLGTGSTSARLMSTLRQSLKVLAPHRRVLREVLPVLLMDEEHGLLGAQASEARQLVEQGFVVAFAGAKRPVGNPLLCDSLGFAAYVGQLGVLLFWLLDRTDGQQATKGMLALLERSLPMLLGTLWLPGVSGMVTTFARLARMGLLP